MATVSIDDPVLKHITETIVREFHPLRIILFGSRARGEAGPDSDYDVLVEMESAKPFYDRLVDIHRALGLRDFSFDVLAFTPAEMAEERTKFYSVAKIAEKEGVTVYDSR